MWVCDWSFIIWNFLQLSGSLSAAAFQGYLCLINLFLFFTLQVEEVYNFSQDDLLTEDILILDTHAEVFIWVGQCVDPKEKQNAFEIGQVSILKNVMLLFPIFLPTWNNWCMLEFFPQKYIDVAASLEGLSLHVPLYKVTEGNEPCFFTTYFSWDHAKATVCAETSIFPIPSLS